MPSLRLVLLAAVATIATAAGPTSAATAKPLEKGDTGARVVQLQKALGLTTDGTFGPGTLRAVKRFQRSHDLEADGIVGARFWRMVRRARAARRGDGAGAAQGSRSSRRGSSRVASRGAPVRLLQRRLDIEADGVFGPGTSRAVKRFQRRRGMTADGIVGPATWRALGVRGRQPVLKRARLRGSSRTRRGSGIPIAVRRAIAAADRIARLPYRYGGGHASFQDTAYDCSGSISYVLHKAGKLDRTLTSGGLMSYGEPGPGKHITIYANAGHAYMVIRGRRYDTSAQRLDGSRWTRVERSTGGYTVRHPPGL